MTDELPFTVLAGKYDEDNGIDFHNCKVAESFITLEEALQEVDKCADYDWRFIEYKGHLLETFNKDFGPW